MIIRKLDPLIYNCMRGIPWIALKWPEIQQYLLTGNIYLMGEAPLEAPSSRKVSFEPEDTQAEESEMEEEGDDISEDGQAQEKEEDPFNPITSSTGVHSTKGIPSGTQRSSKGKEIEGRSKPAFERQNSPTRESSRSQSVSATKKTSEPCHMKRGTYTKRRMQQVETQMTQITLQEKSPTMMMMVGQTKEEGQTKKRKLKKQTDQ